MWVYTAHGEKVGRLHGVSRPAGQLEEGKKPLKDDQWHRIYNIFQVIRHAIWEAESDKQYWTVDSGEPFPSGGEPLPKIEWREKDEKPKSLQGR